MTQKSFSYFNWSNWVNLCSLNANALNAFESKFLFGPFSYFPYLIYSSRYCDIKLFYFQTKNIYFSCIVAPSKPFFCHFDENIRHRYEILVICKIQQKPLRRTSYLKTTTKKSQGLITFLLWLLKPIWTLTRLLEHHENKSQN